jgi:transcriptional regulator with XRE-family HTH domain
METTRLRTLLSANIKARRAALGLSQEKLAELAGLSTRMINAVECCTTWVSDKTLVSLAQALGVEVFRLFAPEPGEGAGDRTLLAAGALGSLRQNIKNEIDTHFDLFLQYTDLH